LLIIVGIPDRLGIFLIRDVFNIKVSRQDPAVINPLLVKAQIGLEKAPMRWE